MKALVTGGAGFIGSNLVDALVARGDEVIVYDDFSTGSRDNINNRYFIKDSILNTDCLNAVCRNGIDLIYHLAARISVPDSIKDPTGTHKVNVDGTLAVLEAARANGCRVVFASSSAVYGDISFSNTWLDGEGTDEDDDKSPCSPYGLSKLIGEEYCGLYSRVYKVPTTCLRFFNVYGPRQSVNSGYSAVIPKFINSLLKDESPVIYGKGDQTRAFTYVDDVVRALILAGDINTHENTRIANRHLVTNITTSKTTSINELVGILKIKLGKESVETIYKNRRVGDILHSSGFVGKANYVLGFYADVGLDVGLDNTINYYKRLV
jgi:nucleoside-diphosphate-sugar epimerase